MVVSHDEFVRLGGQQVRTLLYLLGSDRELDAPAGLELRLDEGTDGVDRKEHHDSEDETVEEVETGVSQLFTNCLDVHLGNGSCIEGEELVVATDLAPLMSGVDDGVLKVRIRSVHLSAEI